MFDPNVLPWWLWLFIGAFLWAVTNSFILPDGLSQQWALRKNTPFALLPFGIVLLIVWIANMGEIVHLALLNIIGNSTIQPWVSWTFYVSVGIVAVYILWFLVKRKSKTDTN